MNSTTMRALGWAIPLICMAGASYATYGQYSRLKADQRTHEQKQAEYAVAVTNLDQARAKVQKEGRYAAAPKVDAEETQFLTDLKRRATNAGVEIIKWSTKTSPASDPATDKDKANTKLLEGIDKVTSDLTLEGAYMPIRTFIEDLNQTKRLYTINNATWNRGEKGGTQLTITVSRYVSEAPDSEPKRTEAKT